MKLKEDDIEISSREKDGREKERRKNIYGDFFKIMYKLANIDMILNLVWKTKSRVTFT